MKSILALDVSKSCTGWAYGLPESAPVSGVERFAREGGTEDEAFGRALVWLTQAIGTMSPAIVAIEAPIKASGGGNTNPASQAMLLGLQGVLRAVVALKLPTPAVLVASSTARKTFTGRGSYPAGEAKDAVMAECRRRGWLDLDTLQPDRADAVCLWAHMAAQQIPMLAHGRPRRA
jgi:hypothetical protein